VDRLSPDGIIEEFLERWGNSDLPGKTPEPVVVANGSVVELNLIAVRHGHQRKGYASRVLRLLTGLCDENGVTVMLVARPMDAGLGFAPDCPATRSTDELVAWYKRHGFLDMTVPGDDTRTMVRTPVLNQELDLPKPRR
jgi:GNAT superfamily N-acetyltransferase